MKLHNLGFPRIGQNRELKFANESYWNKSILESELDQVCLELKNKHWNKQLEASLDYIPCLDFSMYDQVLDHSLLLGAIPERYTPLANQFGYQSKELYFAMARGYQSGGVDVKAMEMTKWLDTNYHYMVPELSSNQKFFFNAGKFVQDLRDAYATLGYKAKPVLLSPVSYLLLSKKVGADFSILSLLDSLLKVYDDIFDLLTHMHFYNVQIDEVALVKDLSVEEQNAIRKVYEHWSNKHPKLNIICTTYFECTGNNIRLATSLPVHALHVDLTRCPAQLDDIFGLDEFLNSKTILSLGLIDGRNIWRNDYSKSVAFIQKAVKAIGEDRVWLAPSCSLLHVPYDLEPEQKLREDNSEVYHWLAFANDKLKELYDLKQIMSEKDSIHSKTFKKNQLIIESRKKSLLTNNAHVQEELASVTDKETVRSSAFSIRQRIQKELLDLPLLPTTTIGSFPQTQEIRKYRALFKQNKISEEEYHLFIQQSIQSAIKTQEEIGLDVFVHGEFERNDMVEYFGELLQGVLITQNGWVQSYGSRCVKPPVIFGDVYLDKSMTVEWTTYAQSLTPKKVKGMLTGPVTILNWSFVRDDQSRQTTCNQIALAIRHEVNELEKAGIKIIQVDEPAIREGLPIRKENHEAYLQWAVKAFRLATSGVNDATQIHTHMCYSDFNSIIQSIAALDADVITIETSRSHMKLLKVFGEYSYPNEIGPGVYDIHSARVPSVEEMQLLLQKAAEVIPAENLWVNPDCGLKTRNWEETITSLQHMVQAAQRERKKYVIEV
ncbi:MAG: 5-methyltetrahydropteroyltriglutamate--homocysteine S-methyltransferase [Cytophagaceae bacterium]